MRTLEVDVFLRLDDDAPMWGRCFGFVLLTIGEPRSLEDWCRPLRTVPLPVAESH